MEVHQAEDKRDHKLLPPSCGRGNGSGNYYYCVALRQCLFEWKDGLVSVKQCFSLFVCLENQVSWNTILKFTDVSNFDCRFTYEGLFNITGMQ